MRIECPQSIQHYSIAFETNRPSFLSLNKKKKFPFGKVRRVTLRPIISLQQIPDAVRRIDEGFEINLRKLQPDTTYILEADYFIENKQFIDSLVNKTISKESLGEEKKEYWIVAQLKHLDVLKQQFGYIEIKDIDFGINVSVCNELKMKIPSIFKQQLETAVNILSKAHGGRDETFKLLQLQRQLARAQRKKYFGEVFEILNNIQELFSSITFRNFVEVQKDFHYFDCMPGKDFYETLPFPTWPKSMMVISRTDLNFNNPVADGLLIFKKRSFLDELDKIFH